MRIRLYRDWSSMPGDRVAARWPMAAAILPLLAVLAACWQPSARAEELPASVSELEAEFFSNVRQVTQGFVRAGEGYFSPDGQTIIYQAVTADYPFYQIYSQALERGVPRLLSTGRGRTTCAYFAPDGRSILFASSHLDPNLEETEAEERRRQAEEAASGQRRRYDWPFDPHMDLFRAELDGSGLVRLTDAPGYDAEGAYSADGKLIAFCSTRDGDPDLFVMNADGSGLRKLVDSPGYDGGPFISPDGQWVVFRSDRHREGYLQIFVVSIDGQREFQLTDTDGVHWAPYWHPTDPYLVWTAADHSNPAARPNYDLYLMKYEVRDGRFIGGPPMRITDHPAADVLPVFSPDGKRLMWTSSRGDDGSSQLWIADVRLPE